MLRKDRERVINRRERRQAISLHSSLYQAALYSAKGTNTMAQRWSAWRYMTTQVCAAACWGFGAVMST